MTESEARGTSEAREARDPEGLMPRLGEDMEGWVRQMIANPPERVKNNTGGHGDDRVLAGNLGYVMCERCGK